jgi:hypothetical protein
MAKMQGKENDPWTSKSVQTNSWMKLGS